MGAAEDQGVDAGLDQRVEVLVGDRAAAPAPPVTPCSTKSTKRGQAWVVRVDLRSGGEGVVVGQRLRRRAGADHPDAAGAGGGHGATGGGQDHLDDRHVVALPGVAQHRRAGRVAGDDQRLHALVDEVVEALEGVLADLADRLGAVGLARGVAEVEH